MYTYEMVNDYTIVVCPQWCSTIPFFSVTDYRNDFEFVSIPARR